MAHDGPKEPSKDGKQVGTLVHRLLDHETIYVGGITIRIERIAKGSAYVVIQAPKSIKIHITKLPIPNPK